MVAMNLGKPVNELLVTDLNKVLDMHQVDKKARGKRDQKRATVAKLLSKPPPLVDSWAGVDEVGGTLIKSVRVKVYTVITQ